MAQFYAEIQGSRGNATRMGTKVSGIWGHVRGWDAGATVYCDHRDGEDFVQVYSSGGSNGRSPGHLLATIKASPKGGQQITLHKPNGAPSITYEV